ncbi:uncharacterized protein LOC144644905 [Oculina patagonica]
MAKLFAFCVFLLCFSDAYGRKCNICTSTTSLADCDKIKKEESCPSGLDYCATLSIKFNIPNVGETKSFTRTCSTKALCDDASTELKACKDAGGECSYKCCDKDLCNGGNAVPMVSIFLLLSCALVTFFR